MKTKSFAAKSKDSDLEYYEFERRELTENDVAIDITYSGVCHSDLHSVHGDWGETEYPCVPGHEIIGTVRSVGTNVAQFNVGDTVGVGVIVGSCGECYPCHEGMEQYCEKGPIFTYGGVDPVDGTNTKGGYADLIVVQEKFVLSIPDGLDVTKAAPLLCAGITMYSPLRHWNAGPGKRVAIVGLGGLGHMGVKYAVAMGAEVCVITTSAAKADQAKAYGASSVIISSNSDEMDAAANSFDLIIDTVPVEHDLSPYISLLRLDGTLCLVGPINPMPGFHAGELIGGRKSIAGSGIGSLTEIVEMLQFSRDHDVLPDVDEIQIEKVNDAWQSLQNKSSHRRFVINIEESFK